MSLAERIERYKQNTANYTKKIKATLKNIIANTEEKIGSMGRE